MVLLLNLALASAWPAPTVQDLPGWLALSGATYESTPWANIRDTPPTVLFAPWDVPEGTAVRALVPGGSVAMTVGAPEQGRYGCDGGHSVDVVPLAGADLPPGMIWVVPPGTEASGLSLETTRTQDARTWAAGGHTVGLTRTGTYTATLWVDDPATVVGQVDVGKNLMAGYTKMPLDMDSSFLAPHVSAAWTIQDATVFGLYWMSFEGVHFEALILRAGQAPVRTEARYLYSCSF